MASEVAHQVTFICSSLMLTAPTSPDARCVEHLLFYMFFRKENV